MDAHPSVTAYLKWTVGPSLLAAIFAAMFYGISTVQTGYYFRTFATDATLLKLATSVVWVLETVHMGLIIAVVYQVVVLDAGRLEKIMFGPMALCVSVFITALLLLILSLFMVYRISRLSRKRFIPWVLAPLAVVRSAFVTTLGILTFQDGRNFPLFITRYRRILITSMAMGALTDVILSVCMVYFLWGKQKVSNFATTTRAIDNLIVFTTETGCITGLLSFVNMICLITMPDNWIWLALHIILPKVYANAFLASMNGRALVLSSDTLPTGRVIHLSSSGGGRSGEADVAVIELQEPPSYDIGKSLQTDSTSVYGPSSNR